MSKFDVNLHKLCRDGDLERIEDYVRSVDRRTLIEHLQLQKETALGYTPIHEAVTGDHDEVLAYLLELGGRDIDVNCRSKSGFTPLHLASFAGRSECVRVLLEYGADLSLADESGRTPKEAAARFSRVIRIFSGEG